MPSLGATTTAFRADTTQFRREMRRARAQLAQFSRSARNARRSLTSFGTALVAGLGLQSFVRTIADFEQAIAGVSAVTRATAQEMQLLTDTARDLGATTEFSATQAANALQFLGQAGFTAAEAVAASADVLNLATAGTLELAEAADIASNVMSGYGIAAEDAGRATDVLAGIASRANTNVRQIGEAMAYVAPVARAMGVSLETSAAALGVMGDAGIQASSAGTALRATLANLANPSNAAADAIERMGLTLSELDPASNNFIDIIERLAGASLSAGDALTIFGNRAAPAVLALTSQVPRLRELEEAMQAAGGEALRMAQIMRDNLGGDIDTLSSSIQELVLSLGDSGLTSVLRSAVQGITAAVRVLAEQSDRIVSYIAGALVAGVARAALGFRVLTAAIITSGNALIFLRGALIRTGIGVLVVGLGEGIFRVTQAVGGFAEAFRFAALIATETFERISIHAQIIRAVIQSSAKFIQFAFVAAFTTILRVADQTIDVLGARISGFVALAGRLFERMAEVAVFAFRQPLKAITQLFDGVINGILERINGLIRAVNSVAGLVGLEGAFQEVELRVSVSSEVEGEALAAGESIGEAFRRGYRESIESSTAQNDPIIDFLTQLQNQVFDQALSYEKLAESLQEVATAPFESIAALREHIQALADDTQAAADTTAGYADNVQESFEGIVEASQELPKATKNVEDLTTAQEELNRVQEFSNKAANSFTDTLRGVINGTQSGSDAVKSFIATLADLILQYTVLIPLAQQLSSAISGAFGGGGLFGGAFASGGFGRGLALVGERGPEFVDLGAGSRVYSNDQLSAALAGGGAPVVNNSFNIQSSDGPGVRAAIAQAVPAIVDASVNTIMNDSNRPGPVRQSLRGY